METPRSQSLILQVVPSGDVSPDMRAEIHQLCNRAYGEDLGPLFAAYKSPTLVLGFMDKELVAHAMWVTRWLQAAEGRQLRTAYVEMVATDPSHRNLGLASQLLRRLASEITDFELGALSPGDTNLYQRLGWVFWRGPLFIRSAAEVMPTPDEKVMILRLPKTPVLDIEGPLSAEWREGELW